MPGNSKAPAGAHATRDADARAAEHVDDVLAGLNPDWATLQWTTVIGQVDTERTPGQTWPAGDTCISRPPGSLRYRLNSVHGADGPDEDRSRP